MLLGSQSKIQFGEDEYEVMGGLLQEPLRVVKAKTVDVLVPADAEVVIEGDPPRPPPARRARTASSRGTTASSARARSWR